MRRGEKQRSTWRVLGTSTSSSQLGATFHLHFCLIPHPFYFHSLAFIYTLLLILLIALRGGICLVTLFVFDAFQLLLSFSVLFSLPFFPIAFNLTPFCLSLQYGLFLQALQSCPATVILLQRHTKKEE